MKKNKEIYAVPQYMVSKYIPKRFIKYIPKMNWKDAYGYMQPRPTLSELAKSQELENFDVAIPIDWVREFEELTGFNPVGHIVMDYSGNSYGEEKAITREGQVALDIFHHIKNRYVWWKK